MFNYDFCAKQWNITQNNYKYKKKFEKSFGFLIQKLKDTGKGVSVSICALVNVQPTETKFFSRVFSLFFLQSRL